MALNLTCVSGEDLAMATASAPETNPPTSGETLQEQPDGPSSAVTTQSRLEALIEQQNLLMLRQLELAEESSKRSETFSVNESDYKTPRQFLKKLDPQARSIFARWQNDFCKKVRAYVTQARLSVAYQEGTAKGELMKPFLEEARKSWEWTDFYRSSAVPIRGVDLSFEASVMVDSADSSEKTQEASPSHEDQAYDVNSAFTELRRRHAWEMQGFVTAHYKACLEKIVEDLTLSTQVHLLQEQVAAWALEHSRFWHPQIKQQLEDQAKNFVELVFREEMPKAESSIRVGNMPSSIPENIVRCACMLAVLLAVVTLSHEVLTHLFAVLFALMCGMALVWEDLVLCSLRVLLGQTVKRVRQLRTMPEMVTMEVPASIGVIIPSVLWR